MTGARWRMFFGRKWLFVLLVLVFGWTLTKLGTQVVNLSEAADPWAASGRFFSAAFSPSLSDENPSLPAITTPFLERTASDLLRTLRYALIAMSLAIPAGVFLGLFASEQWLPNNGLRPFLNALRWLLRLGLSLVRAIHELIWALLFLAAVGDSPLTACLALALPASAILGKVFSELIDEQSRSAQKVIVASGGSGAQGFLGGIFPAALPDMISYALYRFECSLRASATLGFIGIETIGLGIRRSFENTYYSEVWTQLYLLIALVVIVEALGNLVRKRLRIGKPRQKSGVAMTEPTLRRTAPKDHLVRSLGLAAAVLVMASWSFGDRLLPRGNESQQAERLSRFFAQLTPDPVAPDRPVPTWAERREAWDAGSGDLLPWLHDLWESPGIAALTNTVAMSVAAIILASALAFFLIPWGARTLARSQPLGLEMVTGKLRSLVGGVVRAFFILTRAVPEYLYAFLLVGILGPSAWPLVLALALHNVGILGRLWGEVIENRDPRQARQILGMGGSRLQAFIGALTPLSLNRFLLFFFYRWESCLREATVLGMLGVSSLGYFISLRRSFLQYDQIIFFALLGAGAIIAGDIISDLLRKRLRT